MCLFETLAVLEDKTSSTAEDVYLYGHISRAGFHVLKTTLSLPSPVSSTNQLRLSIVANGDGDRTLMPQAMTQLDDYAAGIRPSIDLDIAE